MAFGVKARVEVTATVSGTGAVGSMVANTSRIDFTFLSDGDYTYGYIEQGSLWEECTLTKSGSTLVRSNVISSSSGVSSVSFNGSSSSTVFVDIPVSKLLIAQADGTFANSDALLGTVALSTLTALKNAALPASSGYARYVRGLATATDGTGGWYYWDSADATAGDDYLYVVSNVSGTGRWIRVKQQLDPATAASDGAIKTGAVARVSGHLRSKHATYGALSVPESYNFVKAIFDTYAAFKAVASATWGEGDRIGFNGITAKNDAPYHEGVWNGGSTNTDALDVLFLRPDNITGSNAGRVQFTEPATISTLADGDASPSVKGARNFRASNAGTTLTALDDAIDLQTYTIFPGAANTQLTHSSSFVMPGNVNFTLYTAANGGSPIQIRYDNGIGYLMGAGGAVGAGPLLLSEFGYSSGDSVTAWSAALTAIATGSKRSRTVYLPQTSYLDVGSAVTISTPSQHVGPGLNVTTLRKTGAGDYAVVDIRSGGVRVREIAAHAGAASTAGKLVQVYAPSPNAIPPGDITIETMYLSPSAGGGAVDYCFLADGRLADGTGSPTAYALGIRGLQIDNATIFGPSAQATAAFYGVSGVDLEGYGCYSGGGTTESSGKLLFDGTSTVVSEDITVNIADATGIELGYVTRYDIHVRSGIASANTASYPTQVKRRYYTGPGVITDSHTVNGVRNDVINGDFDVDQIVRGSTTDGQYGIDGWYVLSQTGAVTLSRHTATHVGAQYALKLTNTSGGAQRMGLCQVIPYRKTAKYNNKPASIFGYIASPATTGYTGVMRYAICAWSGGVDVPPKDIVNDWTSSTYTTGNFFTSTTFSVLAQGEITLSVADAFEPFHVCAGAVGAVANLYLFVWTKNTVSNNGTVYLSKMRMILGTVPTEPPPLNFDDELYQCQEFLQTSFHNAVAPAQNLGASQATMFKRTKVDGTDDFGDIELDREMFADPTMTYYNPAAANAFARDLITAADATATATYTKNKKNIVVTFQLPAAAGTAGLPVYVGWKAEAFIGA